MFNGIITNSACALNEKPQQSVVHLRFCSYLASPKCIALAAPNLDLAANLRFHEYLKKAIDQLMNKKRTKKA